MPSKVDDYATDASMGLNENSRESGETNVNELHNDQHGTAPAQINILPENQNDHSMLTPTGNYMSLENSTPDKGHPRKNLVRMTSSLCQKYPIYPRERTKPNVSKPHYKGSDHSNTEISHSENILNSMNTWVNHLTNTKKMLKIWN